jgi:hypothetical protein
MSLFAAMHQTGHQGKYFFHKLSEMSLQHIAKKNKELEVIQMANTTNLTFEIFYYVESPQCIRTA